MMTDVPPGTIIKVNRLPRAVRDIVTVVRWAPQTLEITFEDRLELFARTHIAKPSRLMRLAFKIWWHDVKLFFRGLPVRPMETIREYQGSIAERDQIAELEKVMEDYARDHPLTAGECRSILDEAQWQRGRAEDMFKTIQKLRERGEGVDQRHSGGGGLPPAWEPSHLGDRCPECGTPDVTSHISGCSHGA